MSNQKPYKRRQMIIDPKFQYTFIDFFTALAVIAVFQLYYVGWHGFDILLKEAAKIESAEKDQFLVLIEVLKDSTINVFLICTAVTIGSYLIGGLVFSHRIAGPVYKIRLQLQKMKNSESNETHNIYLRENDFFKELAEDINTVINKEKAEVKED